MSEEHNMASNEAFKQAQVMFLQDERRKAVITHLMKTGMSKAEADEMATQAYRSIKDQRQRNLDIREESGEGASGGGRGVLGFIILLIGVILTFATDRIFYGAMLVGVFMMATSMISREA